MNEAEELPKTIAVDGGWIGPLGQCHDDAVYSLFGLGGTKGTLRAKRAIGRSVKACAEAQAAHEGEIIAIVPVEGVFALSPEKRQ